MLKKLTHNVHIISSRRKDEINKTRNYFIHNTINYFELQKKITDPLTSSNKKMFVADFVKNFLNYNIGIYNTNLKKDFICSS